ncbi:hypothetical protein [Flavihumibacter solisilvae]|uniref:DUF2178 domain-containing protein n=1 Tax=Flavihumibacter solisilvae TaxID=1349421 RepID=A0A0C1L431_9BACT|nr:hypothetical protein [Flavihumibacter solisilvae]KIC94366.1 hypothetical protein OI18_12145 [Flavihumibacter solisilvae]
MNFLLPAKFKKIGAVIAPSGLLTWICMQQRLIDPPPHLVNVALLVICFFSFLGGLYFISFSREKIEDEMVQRTRLDSFQFAALIQIAVMIAGFLVMLFVSEPGKESMILFFAGAIFLFWFSFIARFNYILHIRLKS